VIFCTSFLTNYKKRKFERIIGKIIFSQDLEVLPCPKKKNRSPSNLALKGQFICIKGR
jgi:hypothetical protein